MPRSYTLAPTPAHRAYLEELKSCLGSTGKDLESDVLLAITAQFTGMLIAHLDQRKYTPDLAMEMIMENIVTGNQAALAELNGEPGGHG